MHPNPSLIFLLSTLVALATANDFQPLGTQSCKASDLDKQVNYEIHIGEYFDNGGEGKCHAAVAALTTAFRGNPPTTTECSFGAGCCTDNPGGAGMPVLKGVSAMRGNGGKINAALRGAFPGIGSNCPDY
jgi:hypothetical protein